MIARLEKLKNDASYVKLQIIVSFGAVILNALTTVKTVEDVYGDVIGGVSFLLFGILAFDFLLNFIIHADKKSYLTSFSGVIDLLASIPFVMRVVGFAHPDVLTVFVAIGFLKLSRYSPALTILKDVIVSERKPLVSALYVMFLLMTLSSTLLYFLEREANGAMFSSIPQAMWWAIITLATVGYGDMYPITTMGRIVGGFAAVLGLGMFALPAGILASGFAEEVKRLRDVASWNMVANVPIFAKLQSDMISEIVSELRVRHYVRNQMIIKEGDIGSAMYFILEGEVDVKSSSWHGTLTNGSFFGEIAILYSVPRTATIVAKTRCDLLELTAIDFNKITASRPDVLEIIERVAKERYNK